LPLMLMERMNRRTQDELNRVPLAMFTLVTVSFRLNKRLLVNETLFSAWKQNRNTVSIYQGHFKNKTLSLSFKNFKINTLYYVKHLFYEHVNVQIDLMLISFKICMVPYPLIKKKKSLYLLTTRLVPIVDYYVLVCRIFLYFTALLC
jgi:hypothetical protein